MLFPWKKKSHSPSQNGYCQLLLALWPKWDLLTILVVGVQQMLQHWMSKWIIIFLMPESETNTGVYTPEICVDWMDGWVSVAGGRYWGRATSWHISALNLGRAEGLAGFKAWAFAPSTFMLQLLYHWSEGGQARMELLRELLGDSLQIAWWLRSLWGSGGGDFGSRKDVRWYMN